MVLVAGTALGEDAPVAEFAQYGEYGEVLGAIEAGGKAYVRANGFWGYHPEEDPYMTVDVTIGSEGLVEKVTYVGSKAQTEGFPQMLTADYYGTYKGRSSATVLEVDAVSGATATAKAVAYAVETALYYADKAYGIAADTTAAERDAFAELWPGDYRTVTSEYVVDSAKLYGTVLFAAEDDASLAMKIQSSKKLNYKKSSDTGWPNAEPDQYVMLIVIDKASQQVVASKVVVDGTKRPEYFTVPGEKLEAYTKVPVTEETVFDEFTDGLVFGLEFEFAKDSMGLQVITGTSVIYTGASVDGTFSSQLIRRCFQTAARYFCHYAE